MYICRNHCKSRTTPSEYVFRRHQDTTLKFRHKICRLLEKKTIGEISALQEEKSTKNYLEEFYLGSVVSPVAS